jgi:hypothetical protein
MALPLPTAAKMRLDFLHLDDYPCLVGPSYGLV